MTKKSEIATGSNGEPLGKKEVDISCQHVDKLPQGTDVIKTVEESEAHIKTENVRGIHEGKRPKFVPHPVENA